MDVQQGPGAGEPRRDPGNESSLHPCRMQQTHALAPDESCDPQSDGWIPFAGIEEDRPDSLRLQVGGRRVRRAQEAHRQIDTCGGEQRQDMQEIGGDAVAHAIGVTEVIGKNHDGRQIADGRPGGHLGRLYALGAGMSRLQSQLDPPPFRPGDPTAHRAACSKGYAQNLRQTGARIESCYGAPAVEPSPIPPTAPTPLPVRTTRAVLANTVGWPAAGLLTAG